MIRVPEPKKTVQTNTPVGLKVLMIGYMHGQGGIQSHTHFLATGLTERGHSVLVLTPKPFEGHEPVDPTGRPYALQTYDGMRDISATRMEGGPIDIAVVCGTGWAAMGGVRLNRAIRKRVFFEVMSGEKTSWRDPRTLVHTGFDAIVGQASPVEARFNDEFHWSGPSITIPALPEPLERAATIPTRSKSDLRPVGELRLAYFGRLALHKGVGFLIDHWSTLSEFADSLDIWGSGEEFDALSSKIESQGLTDQIRLCGRYPEGREYIELLQRYDLKLLPTVGAEGAPLVLLEAMACGLPFVANGVGGIPDYANEDVRITDGKIDAFLPLLQAWVQQHESGDVDPARLQRHYQSHYAFDVLVDRWETFLEALATGADLKSEIAS